VLVLVTSILPEAADKSLKIYAYPVSEVLEAKLVWKSHSIKSSIEVSNFY